MNYWFPSRKGYTTMIDFENRCTVFYRRHSGNWCYVVNKEFSPDFGDVFSAMNSAERRHQFRAGRDIVENLDPEERWRRDFARAKDRHERFKRYHRQRAREKYERGEWAGQDTEAPEDPATAAPHMDDLWWVDELELEGNAPWSIPEIRRAFAMLAMQHHPDVGGSPAKMQRLQEAWEAAQGYMQKQQKQQEEEPPF